MSINDLLVEIMVGVAASLAAAGLIWYFRRQLREAFVSLDMSTGAILAWVLVFLLTIVIIVLSLLDKEIPGALELILGVVVVYVLVQTVFSRRI